MAEHDTYGDPTADARPTDRRDRYADRRQAGRKLGAVLQGRSFGAPVVFGIPHGGVEVAIEVARALDAPLDVIVATKVGWPNDAEVGVGAVAEGLPEPVGELGTQAPRPPDPHAIDDAVDHARTQVRRAASRFRGRDLPELHGRTAIVVDDGIATGATARAALRALERHQPDRLVVATPVGARHAVDSLGALAEVICLARPTVVGSVGAWYEHYPQLDDDDVDRLLGATT